MMIPMVLALSLRMLSGDGASGADARPQMERPPVDAPGYRIGPEDVLQVSVWGNEAVSRTAPVRPDGRISLPLLNDVQAAGLTPMQLAAVIGEGLKKYITNPQDR